MTIIYINLWLGLLCLMPLSTIPVFSYGSKEEKENFRQKGKQTKTGKRHQRTGVSH
jgi:hypothetical protein